MAPLDVIFISNIPPFVVKNVTKLLQKMFTKNIWRQCMLTKLIGMAIGVVEFSNRGVQN